MMDTPSADHHAICLGRDLPQSLADLWQITSDDATTCILKMLPCAGKLNGGNNPLNPYVNSNVNASSVAAQLFQGAAAAGQLARSFTPSTPCSFPP